jgi:nitrile hydratase accessory protein
MSTPLDLLPAIVRDEHGPVFREPWEAQAFAMTLKLHEAGYFAWQEWTDYLSAEIAAARERGEPDRGDTYYRYWLAALEKITADKGILAGEELDRRRRQLDG